MSGLAGYLQTATEAAREAGRILRTRGDSLLSVNHQDARDVKLQADEDSEEAIRAQLRSTRLPVIGEEAGGDDSLVDGDRLYWIVDPLDGTSNYQRNIPFTAVSIGLMRGERPLLGVVYDFNTDELYAGGDGIPLRVNGRTVRPHWASSPSAGILCCGFPAGRDFGTQALGHFIKRIQAFRKVRMIGTATLALAYVAVGRADAYYEESIRLWDVAAGLALVIAAGGTISMTRIEGQALTYDVRASGCGW